MTENKAGRNDPCPCGSGKKYKQCCMSKQQQKITTLTGRKFTAKVISAGGSHKPTTENQSSLNQAIVDYNTLMDRSFGEAIHSKDEMPPVPENPSQYLVQEKEKN